MLSIVCATVEPSGNEGRDCYYFLEGVFGELTLLLLRPLSPVEYPFQ